MYQISSNLRELQHFRYAGVPYIIAGLKSNQLKTKEHEEFDRLPRREQILIEHVNCFLKKCKVLSKKNVFNTLGVVM